jgi:hypothetical protein
MVARASILGIRILTAAFAIAFLVGTHSVQGQTGGGFGFFQQAIGGIRVDPNNALTGQLDRLDADLRAKLAQQLKSADADIKKSGLRMISLKGVQAEMAKALTAGKAIDAELQYLCGIQRIEYVIADPENNDVILAGFGEDWRVNELGNVVGVSTGRPVLKLEDLLVAMRTVENARRDYGISVSIDPTAEGVERLQKFYSRNAFEPALAPQVEQAMGDNLISLTGVPADSRYAQILVAADHKMKRLSMGLDTAPIANFPSMLEMIQAKNAEIRTMSPRFWMECAYQPIAKSEDGMVWQIRGTGVKTLTEEAFATRTAANKDKAPKANKFASQWAEMMTERFEELAAAEPIFWELRNLMDMSVVAALIAKEELLVKANLDLAMINGSDNQVSTPTWNVPKTVPAQCSYVLTNRAWIVTASGGIQVDSWGVVAKTETVASLQKSGELALNRTADRWWWNAAN